MCSFPTPHSPPLTPHPSLLNSHPSPPLSLPAPLPPQERVKGWEVLVVDEVSMLSAEMWEVVEGKLREVSVSNNQHRTVWCFL